MHCIEVFSKPGCHLCERAISVLEDLQCGKKAFQLEIVDITKDRTSFEKYFLTIPAVRVDGKDVFGAEDLAKPDECRTRLESLVSGLE